MRPLVSVIIPTYRHRDYVLETLESVWAQSFTDFEVIVVNDGSPDDTAEVLRPLFNAGKIRYIGQPNSGQGAARNRGLAEARGEYIAFLDDDDLWPPDKLQWQVQELESKQELGLIAGERLMFKGEPPIVFDPVGRERKVTFESLFEGCAFSSPGQTLIRSCVLHRVGGFDESLSGSDDWDIYMRLARIVEMELQPRVALLYRQHGENASQNLRRMMQSCRKVVKKHLPEVPIERRGKAAEAAAWFLYKYLGGRILREAKNDMRERRCASGLRHLLVLAPLCGSMALVPALARKFIWDAMPVRMRNWRKP